MIELEHYLFETSFVLQEIKTGNIKMAKHIQTRNLHPQRRHKL